MYLLVICFLERSGGNGLQILDILQLLPESSAQDRAEDGLSHSSICAIDLQDSEFRPEDRSDGPHIVRMVYLYGSEKDYDRMAGVCEPRGGEGGVISAQEYLVYIAQC